MDQWKFIREVIFHIFTGANLIFFPFLNLDEFRNLHNCSINIILFQRCPAICVDADGDYFGYEWELINEIADTLNFYPNFLRNSSYPYNRFVDGEADIAIGNFRIWEENEIMDFSSSYYSIPLVFVVPAGMN